jgi:hypothetical protein
MNESVKGFALAIALSLFAPLPGPAQTRQRSEVVLEDTWRLEDLYPSDAAWKEAKAELAAIQDRGEDKYFGQKYCESLR